MAPKKSNVHPDPYRARVVPRLAKCENLEASVSLRARQDDGKKRQHLLAMEQADDVATKLKAKMIAFKLEEGKWRWKRAKQIRQMGVDEQKLNVMKWDAEHARKKTDRKSSEMTKRGLALELQGAAVCKASAKVAAERKVTLFILFHFVPGCFPSFEGTCFAVCLP
jgi:hypothetical protein